MCNAAADFYNAGAAAAEYNGMFQPLFAARASRSACAGCFGETPRPWRQEMAHIQFAVSALLSAKIPGARVFCQV